MALNVMIDRNPEEELKAGHIKKIVVDGIFQPLEINYKYRKHGDGVFVPMDSISWKNSDNGTDVPLGNNLLFNEIKKVCCIDAQKRV